MSISQQRRPINTPLVSGTLSTPQTKSSGLAICPDTKTDAYGPSLSDPLLRNRMVLDLQINQPEAKGLTRRNLLGLLHQNLGLTDRGIVDQAPIQRYGAFPLFRSLFHCR